MKTIILGAGVTGLAAGIKTGATIYEASDRPGGICRSYYVKGYRFENGGGHWIFGDDQIRKILNHYSEMEEYERKAGVFLNTTLPYPIQGVNDDEEINPGSLKAWMKSKFGSGMCNVFFHPFHEKYTAGFYNHVIQEDVNKSPDPKGKGYNVRFSYPKKGLDSLVDSLSKDLDIRYNKKVIRIDPVNRILKFKCGHSVQYDRLISTIPLDSLIMMIGVPTDDLPKTSVLVLNIGAEPGKNFPEDHWLYVPYCKSGFFRVGFYSNVNKSFAPEGRVGIYVERAFTHRISNMNSYLVNVVKELKEWGWIGNCVDVVDESWIDCAYTWKFPRTDVNKYLKMLKISDIHSIGRYGKWRFQGISDSFLDGLGVTVD